MDQASRTNLAGTKHVIDFARCIRKTGARGPAASRSMRTYPVPEPVI